ncbi:MAG: hypothetical protein Q8L45_00940 [Xanthomonadaceae bacterium]|nr:hypothetical protein [Xanthomonadaceae bacterium]MDP2183850.1 hypothetical protein [Xanthomonadales bacterium]MDZ4115503.1 hypothetical protein [Xanthomonadaceae bacterium]MDZ4377135.1 hypothetical protein [Xanthomonadaceae bacterium]
MKRIGLGAWALIALLGVGVALVVARRFHDGDAPVPGPASVEELADSPVAGALPDVGPSPASAHPPDAAACFNLLNTQPHGCTRELAAAGQRIPTSLIIPESVRLQMTCTFWIGAWDQAHCQ